MEHFTENIKKWVKLDNETRKLAELLRSKREQKNRVLEQIIEYKNRRELDDNTSIKISDGVLKFTQYRQYQPLNYGYLKTSLNKLFSEEETNRIIKHIKDERTFNLIQDIKRL